MLQKIRDERGAVAVMVALLMVALLGAAEATSYNNTIHSEATCTGSCKGLIGQFVSYASLDDRFTTGGPNLGTSIVTLE
jgi:hypothetical protein